MNAHLWTQCTFLGHFCRQGSHSRGCLVACLCTAALSVRLHCEPLIWERDPPNPVHAQSRRGDTVPPSLLTPTCASSTSEHAGVAQSQGLASGCHSLVPGKEAQGGLSLSPTAAEVQGPIKTWPLAQHGAPERRGEARRVHCRQRAPVGTSQGDFSLSHSGLYAPKASWPPESDHLREAAQQFVAGTPALPCSTIWPGDY